MEGDLLYARRAAPETPEQRLHAANVVRLGFRERNDVLEGLHTADFVAGLRGVGFVYVMHEANMAVVVSADEGHRDPLRAKHGGWIRGVGFVYVTHEPTIAVVISADKGHRDAHSRGHGKYTLTCKGQSSRSL